MEYPQEVKNRLKRIEGQIRGVLRMMEEGKQCKEVITQLSAARSAVDRSIGYIIAKNLEASIREQVEKGNTAEEEINQAIEMLIKSR